jgi:hypothetical protein
VSKAEVLDMAWRHIKSLERQRETMQQEKVELMERLERLEWVSGVDGSPGAGVVAGARGAGGTEASGRRTSEQRQRRAGQPMSTVGSEEDDED